MEKQDHSYRAIERLLRAGANASAGAGAASAGAGAGALCVDGETLAAWSAGALPAADAARIETHLADCDRCQAMIAAFARTEPIVAAPSWLARRSFSEGGKRAQMRWLVPLATAATVAAIWVAIPQRNEPLPSVADSRQAVPLESPSAPSAPAQVEPQTPSQSPPALRDQATTNPTLKSTAPKREADVSQERKEEALAQRDAGARAAPGAGSTLGSTASARAADSLVRRDTAAEGMSARQRSAAPPAAAPGVAGAPPSAPLAESVSIAPETRQLFAKSNAEFASPGDATRWRIAGGQVQRSTTQGRIWEVVALPSGATITAGHAPAPSVAWLIGRAGAIFVTTDGTRFERVPFPHAVDLASILAVDDRQATVVTVDGRVFGTSNRGGSWIQP